MVEKSLRRHDPNQVNERRVFTFRRVEVHNFLSARTADSPVTQQ
jgi:hypothetical protein